MVLDNASLRKYMTLTNVTEIVDGQFDDAITESTSTNLNVTSDETALKYYAAYLLAISLDWKTLKKDGDTEFFEQKPQSYLKLYNLRVSALLNQQDNSIMGSIVNSDPKFN